MPGSFLEQYLAGNNYLKHLLNILPGDPYESEEVISLMEDLDVLWLKLTEEEKDQVW